MNDDCAYHDHLSCEYDNDAIIIYRVRETVPEWVQYEDSEGVPYYYDPVTKASQYRLPEDANYHHYTVDERAAYDATHGDGAYDIYNAEIAFRQAVNRDGGYWDSVKGFIQVFGHYDENGEFVTDVGYYDEKGRYRLNPKPEGDLSFMV